MTGENTKVLLKSTTIYILMKVLLPAFVTSVIVGLSFIFWGPFSSLAYSDRLFLTGIGFMAMGTIVIFAQMITTRGMEIFFGGNRNPDLVKKSLNLLPGSKEEVESRYNIGAQIWFIGLACMVFGALVTFIFR